MSDSSLSSVREVKILAQANGKPFASVLVLKRSGTKTAANGNPFLSLELGDRTGSFGCTVFSDSPVFEVLKAAARRRHRPRRGQDRFVPGAPGAQAGEGCRPDGCRTGSARNPGQPRRTLPGESRRALERVCRLCRRNRKSGAARHGPVGGRGGRRRLPRGAGGQPDAPCLPARAPGAHRAHGAGGAGAPAPLSRGRCRAGDRGHSAA